MQYATYLFVYSTTANQIDNLHTSFLAYAMESIFTLSHFGGIPRHIYMDNNISGGEGNPICSCIGADENRILPRLKFFYNLSSVFYRHSTSNERGIKFVGQLSGKLSKEGIKYDFMFARRSHNIPHSRQLATFNAL